MATPKKAGKPKKADAPPDEVDAFMAGLDQALKADIETVRRLILRVSPEIAEGIRWNAPSFRRTDWFATFHFRSRDSVQLVMHTGAKKKDNPALDIPDPKGLIRWLAKDRCLVTLGSGTALRGNAKAFAAIVKAWIRYV